MHDTTKRFLEMAWRLESAGVQYGLDLDPEFAILMSFQDARELYSDLMRVNPIEIHYYRGTSLEGEQKSVSYPLLPSPPYPDGKRVVWATIEGLRIAIKGREDQ
jgi:hypothetical protein